MKAEISPNQLKINFSNISDDEYGYSIKSCLISFSMQLFIWSILAVYSN